MQETFDNLRECLIELKNENIYDFKNIQLEDEIRDLRIILN